MNYSFIVPITFLSLLAVGACASNPGNESLKEESATSVQNKMVEGQTTKPQVQAMFGAPLRTSYNNSGEEVWTYELTDTSADGIAYVPVVNWFAGTASGTKKELVVFFDQQGVLKRYSMNESEVTENTGAFNR